MKKYRLTKITVKTREIVLATNLQQDSSCPLCHQPLASVLPPNESSADKLHINEQAAELSPAKTSDENHKYKEDRYRKIKN